jgi:hypothetical protein
MCSWLAGPLPVLCRYMYIHSVDELQPGTALTFNKLGADVMAPLGERTAASLKLFGRPCGCKRCQAEAGLPQEVSQQLRGAWEAAQGAWPDALEAAAQEQDVDALAELQVCVGESGALGRSHCHVRGVGGHLSDALRRVRQGVVGAVAWGAARMHVVCQATVGSCMQHRSRM